MQYKPKYKNKKIQNLEAEIFCYAPSKQESSLAWIWKRFLKNELHWTLHPGSKSLKTYCQKY